jgi:hypothetical protein
MSGLSFRKTGTIMQHSVPERVVGASCSETFRRYDRQPIEAKSRSNFFYLASSLDHNPIGLNRIMISFLCLSMIFSENRFPLFRIMLDQRWVEATNLGQNAPIQSGRVIFSIASAVLHSNQAAEVAFRTWP